MSDAWTPDLSARAERVPVWTRPTGPRFVAAPAPGQPAGFTPWTDEAEAPPANPEPETLDPDAARTEGFAQGFHEGYAAGEAALDAERAALAVLAGRLGTLKPEPPADLARLLAETVTRLVRQVVGEVEVNAAALAERTGAVAALLAEESAPARLRLNPVDVARLEAAGVTLALVPDPALAEGTILAETATGWIEDGPAIRLERLRALLDQMGARR